MADTLTTNYSLVKPESGSVNWHPKVNSNSDIIDAAMAGYLSRLSALESSVGGATLPPGSTWQDVLDAYDDAAPGGLIITPNEPIAQTSCLKIWDKPIHLRGSGPNSAFVIQGDMDIEGTRVQIHIGAIDDATERLTLTENVSISNIKLVHDRVAGPTSMRTRGFGIGRNVNNILIDNVAAEGITSQFVAFLSYEARCSNVTIKNCVANEFYESMFDVHGGRYLQNIYILNNIGTVSLGHPLGFPAVSRPYGLYMAIEDDSEWAIYDNFHWHANEVYADFTDGSYVNSIGIDVNGGSLNTWVLSNCSFTKNILSGFHFNHIWPRKGFARAGRRAFAVFSGNKIINNNDPIFLISNWAYTSEDTDTLIFSDNDFIGTGAVTVAGDGNLNIVYAPPNRHYVLPTPALSPDITESFNTADSATLGPDLTWIEHTGVTSIVSNKAQSVSSLVLATADSALAGPNHYAQALVDCVPHTADNSIGVFIRSDGSGAEPFYSLELGAFAYDEWFHILIIWRFAGGVFSPLGNYEIFNAPGTPHTIALSANGPELTAYLDGEVVIRASDNLITTGNYTGIRGASPAGDVITWDAFAAGAL